MFEISFAPADRLAVQRAVSAAGGVVVDETYTPSPKPAECCYKLWVTATAESPLAEYLRKSCRHGFTICQGEPGMVNEAGGSIAR